MSRLENLAIRFKADLGHTVIIQRQSNRNQKCELKISYSLQVTTNNLPRLHLSKVPPAVIEHVPKNMIL